MNPGPLFRLLDSHYEEFRNLYDERFSKRYGYWRHVTDEVVEKYLQCGDPHFGFARIRCKECGAEYLRAFSCKCRGFIPSSADAPGILLQCSFMKHLIAEKLVCNMRSWKHSGFSVYRAEPIEVCDDNGRKPMSERRSDLSEK